MQIFPFCDVFFNKYTNTDGQGRTELAYLFEKRTKIWEKWNGYKKITLQISGYHNRFKCYANKTKIYHQFQNTIVLYILLKSSLKTTSKNQRGYKYKHGH